MIAESSTVPAGNRVSLEPSGFLAGELRKLARQSSHYLAGLAGGLLLGFISFPIYTRAFPVAEYGLIDLSQKVLTLIAILSKSGLQNAALRFYDGRTFNEDPASARTYYSTMFLGTLLTSALVAGACVVVILFTRRLFAGGAVASLMHLILILAVLRAAEAMLFSFLRIEERTKAFNIASVGVKAAGIAGVCILLTSNFRTAQAYLTGLLVAEAALVVALSAPLLWKGQLRIASFAPGFFRRGIAFGLPLVVYELAFAVLGSADRFLVRQYLGDTALGTYSVASTLSQHANELLLVPLYLAIVPIYMRLWNEEGSRKTAGFLTFALDLYFLGAAGILAIAAACAEDGVVLLASSKYAAAGRLIPVMLAGLLVYATHFFVAAGLLIQKRTMQMAALLTLSAVLVICLNAALLPRLGLMGGALAALLSYSACMLSLWRASNRVLPLRLNLPALGRYIAAAAIAWVAAGEIRFERPLANVVSRFAVALTVYGCALYLLDCRVRRSARWAVARCRSRTR